MDEQLRHLLEQDRVVDITTIGRSSGRPHQIETWLWQTNGRLYLTGSPGKRDWYANLLANPDFTVHLNRSVKADLAARATPITDQDTRRTVMKELLSQIGQSQDLEAWVAGSPLAAVEIGEFESR